jgi:two-component system sensor histidine kinase AlgZ
LQALQASELRALKSQLNPHFLFNALNSVRALIGDEPELARTSITQLSRMLRYTLAAGEEDLVQFARELEITDDYLALESLRLAERLIIRKEIASSAAGARIPVMLLQTLVENAVKHGIAQLPEGGTLRISAAVADGVLALELENPRPDGTRASSEPRSTGIGLANATERLRLLFGPRATLALDLSQPGSAIARVRIPQTP